VNPDINVLDKDRTNKMYNYIWDHSVWRPGQDTSVAIDHIIHMLATTPVYQQDTTPLTIGFKLLDGTQHMHVKCQEFLYLLHRIGVRPRP